MQTKRPTESELAILQVLWRLGPSTVRDVFDALKERKPTGYTTVLKILQIMLDKGYVSRDETERSHRYVATLDREVTQTQLVRDLIERAFGGSTLQLITRALNSEKISTEDLAKIRTLVDERRKRC